ncbi:MAG: hypothetical protein E7656_06005 [Ruminococcaceae bacterium]|nr:hypothetical protein [Oscillospiraceae bacterium]
MLSPKRITGVLLAVLASVFVIYYVYRQVIGVSRDRLLTENAVSITVEKTIDSTGFIFRTEKVLDGVPSGTVFPSVSDGERVGANREIATIYSSQADAGNKSRLDEIENELFILGASTVDQEFFSADVEKMRKDCNEALDTVVRSKADNDFLDCVMKKNELLISMNKLENVTLGTDFSEQIKMLESEKDRLSSGQGESYGKIYAPTSGYYTGIVDGYENIFVPSSIEYMTVDGFREITARQPQDAVLASNAGKLITDSRWYVLCEVPNEDAAVFKKIDEKTQRPAVTSCDVVFPFDGNVRLEMRVERVISETDKASTVLVFSTDEMPDSFSFTRSQKIEIVSESYTGLRVPKQSMRKLDNKINGVYVLVGETVSFRRAEPIYEAEDWYIVRASTDEELEKAATENSEEITEDTLNDTEQKLKTDETDYKYLSLYDSVIVEGKELFDGKRVK